ncbi:MAG: response regulator transcription factor [Gammaproteobacteria bacterium]|nr:response regulator transcription factor [Gammaproteobacteria bacterium]
MHYPKLNILIIEDQLAIASNIADFFEAKGHLLDFAYQGEYGLQLALENPYDVIVLDLMLPKMDGFKVCEEIRKKNAFQVPILILTARTTMVEKIKGFQLGADDYLTKPFALEELEMRCLALSRRRLLNLNHTIKLGELVIDRQRQSVARGGKRVKCKHLGYKIIEILAESYPKVVTRSELIHKLWGDQPTESDALRSHIYQLRTVLDKPFAEPLLKTVYGIGFTLDVGKLADG